MGFTALDGLSMGTRCGQLDPGVVLYLLAEKKMSAEEISDLLWKNSGLKGMSGVSQDMRELEASDSPAARDAIAYFVSRVVIGVFLMTISFFLTLGLLQRFDLSYLYPFQGLSVIFITMLAAVVLKEKLSARLTIGALLITAGIVLVSMS